MSRVRNAFKIRAADAPIIETSQFLHLYCPLLLDQLQSEDLFVPKLIVIRGSPGSGKSSLLRLFEADTLLTIHGRRTQSSDQDLIDRLSELQTISETGPRVIGIYIQCDSSLRDIANLPPDLGAARLFNTLLDTRIVVSFLRVLRRLADAKIIRPLGDTAFESLPAGDAPPRIFAHPASLAELESRCNEIERDFGTLLNSFPGDPLPLSIQPHARVYSLAYLALQIQRHQALAEMMPVVMLDDVQELYPDQRRHLRDEFIRRASIPRWLAVRTHVCGLEELISLEGAQQGREFRELDIGEIFVRNASLFPRFASDVIHRRLQHTEALQQVTINDFKDLLRPADDAIPSETSQKVLASMTKRAKDAGYSALLQERIESESAGLGPIPFGKMHALEQSIILLERQANRGEVSLFPEMGLLDKPDAKTEEAATLFLCRWLRRPYYCEYDALVKVASSNVEQLLSVTSDLVDRMIYRAELNRDKAISAKDQEDMIKRCAEKYFLALEEKHRRGAAIRQFVDNLGRFCDEVTYRPNAPIAPGVNGFGLTPEELQNAVAGGDKDPDGLLFREVLTSAVAGNVLSVRPTKQGQAGKEKIVFYLNRLLCVKYRLPLNYGGWQHIPTALLVRMMREPVPLAEMGRKVNVLDPLFSDAEE
jgi:hypothetical protein